MNLSPSSYRDRRGRGLRGPLFSGSLPARLTRAEAFRRIVATELRELVDRFPAELSAVEFAIRLVPPVAESPRATVTLGRIYPATPGTPAHVVLFRRPIESRASTETDLSLLIREVLVEQVAILLGLRPEEVDPRY